jgi:hypothetical protein
VLPTNKLPHGYMQFGTAGTNSEGTNDTDGDKMPTCDATNEHQDVVLQVQQAAARETLQVVAAQTPGWMLHLLLLINLPASPDVTDVLRGFYRAGLHWRRICRMVLPRSRQASSSRVLPVAMLLMNRQAEACRSTRDCSVRCFGCGFMVYKVVHLRGKRARRMYWI